MESSQTWHIALRMEDSRMHKHNFRVSSYIIDRIYAICDECGCTEDRETTKEEKEMIINDFEKHFNPTYQDDVHRVWHPFEEWFEKLDDRGYSLIKKIENYIDNHPEAGIKQSSVDDDCFNGSSIFFIPHESDNSYMGVTAIYVPQSTGEKPVIFFMYPHHIDDLIKTLKHFAKKKSMGYEKLNIKYEDLHD